ncbi:hypothetical protein FKW77_008194 [Venturia effusa]|uniref:Uncharacterized protein n=1 Tax=Venturia effusa TaxID=50376 RepID=A0A517LHP8_9PEZI|nr:hypothetical protein FKW77_008194 [Venturia effusa]
MSDQTPKKAASKNEEASASPSSTLSSQSTVVLTPEETPIQSPVLTMPSNVTEATLPNLSNFTAISTANTPAERISSPSQDPQYSPPGAYQRLQQTASAEDRSSPQMSAFAPNSPNQLSRDFHSAPQPTALEPTLSLAQLSLAKTSNPPSSMGTPAATTPQTPTSRTGMYPYGQDPEMYMNHGFDQSAYGPYPGAFPEVGNNSSASGLNYGPPSVRRTLGDGTSRQPTHPGMSMGSGCGQSNHGAFPGAFAAPPDSLGQPRLGPPSARLGDNPGQQSSSSFRYPHAPRMTMIPLPARPSMPTTIDAGSSRRVAEVALRPGSGRHGLPGPLAQYNATPAPGSRSPSLAARYFASAPPRGSLTPSLYTPSPPYLAPAAQLHPTFVPPVNSNSHGFAPVQSTSGCGTGVNPYLPATEPNSAVGMWTSERFGRQSTGGGPPEQALGGRNGVPGDRGATASRRNLGTGDGRSVVEGNSGRAEEKHGDEEREKADEEEDDK